MEGTVCTKPGFLHEDTEKKNEKKSTRLNEEWRMIQSTKVTERYVGTALMEGKGMRVKMNIGRVIPD